LLNKQGKQLMQQGGLKLAISIAGQDVVPGNAIFEGFFRKSFHLSSKKNAKMHFCFVLLMVVSRTK